MQNQQEWEPTDAELAEEKAFLADQERQEAYEDFLEQESFFVHKTGFFYEREKGDKR